MLANKAICEKKARTVFHFAGLIEHFINIKYNKEMNSNNSKTFSFGTVFPCFFIACLFLVLLNNLFYGYGWTDESFYLSNVHRLYCGDRLFIDDWSPTQTYIPLLLPFYSLYLKINGTTDGVYLFFRILTLLFQTVTACTAYRILSKNNSRSVSLAFSALLMVFARAGISGPSYYTLCLMNCALGVLLLYEVFENHGKQLLMVFAGIFLALSVLCNPYLVLPYIAFSLLALIIPRARKHWKLFLLCWAGTAASAVLYIFLFVPLGSLGEFSRSLHYIFNDPAYGKGIVLTIKKYIKMPRLLLFPYIITYLPMIITLAVIKRRKTALSSDMHTALFILNTVLLAVNFFIVRITVEAAVMALFFYTILALASTRELAPKQWYAEFRQETVYSIMPGLALSYFFCLASDTGFGVCAIGIAFASFGLFSVIQKCYAFKKRFLIPLAMVLACTLCFRIALPYRDAPAGFHLLFIPRLQKNAEKITSGSAKGLYTTKEHKKQYDLVFSTMQSLNCKDGDGLLISQLIPWAYIERKELRCAAPTTWRLFPNDYRIEPYFTDFPEHRFPQFVLIVSGTIRDNGRINDNEGEPWLAEQLELRNYEKTEVPCGILYTAP